MGFVPSATLQAQCPHPTQGRRTAKCWGASKPCPPAQQNCSYATLRALLPVHCLPSGLPAGKSPRGDTDPQKPTLFLLMPMYVWIAFTAQCLSSGHPYTCPTEPYGLALGFSSACTHAIHAQPCPAPSGHVVTFSVPPAQFLHLVLCCHLQALWSPHRLLRIWEAEAPS